MRSVLKALVTVELQLCGDLFLSLGCSDRGENKVNILFGSGLVSNNTVVKKVTDNRKVQNTLLYLNIRNIRYPFLIGAFCVEISVEQIRISVQIFAVITVFLTTDDGKQIVLLHYTKYGGILMYSLSFTPYMHSAVAVCAATELPDILESSQQAADSMRASPFF